MVRAAWMEKIMSKTDTPNDHRPLADSELDAVSGGTGIPGTGDTDPGTDPVTGGNLYVGETVGGRRIQKFLRSGALLK